MEEIEQLYADLSACLLAIANALDASGSVKKAALAESFQERLLALQLAGHPDAKSPDKFLLLRRFALELLRSPKQ